MNIQTWLQNATQQLSRNKNFEISSPNLDAEALLMQALGINRARIYTYPEETISENNLLTLEKHLSQRLSGMPIAYILRKKEFWSLNFKVSPAVLIPRPETEHLVETVLDLLETSTFGTSILELGTGSGAIAIALSKERPHWKILACDNSEEALAIAKENAMYLLLDNVIIQPNTSIFVGACPGGRPGPPIKTDRGKNHLGRPQGDAPTKIKVLESSAEKILENKLSFQYSHWFDHIPAQKFSAIVSNPPYIDSNDSHLKALQHEPMSALIADENGLADIREIIKKSPDYLETNGFLLLEHGNTQAAAVSGLLDKAGFAEIKTIQDLAGCDRVTYGKIL